MQECPLTVEGAGSCGSLVQQTDLPSGGERRAIERGVRSCALLGSRRPGAGATGDDRVPTAASLHQAHWREAHGHPIGSQPIVPRPGGSRRVRSAAAFPSTTRSETGANFLTASALAAARARTSIIEPHQSFDHQRLWADLLSSEALAFNLFGDLAADLRLADRAVHAWWPDAPRHGVRRPLRALAGPPRSGLPQQPPRVRCGVRARPRRRDAGDRRRRHQVPRAAQARDPEAEQPRALPGGRRAVGRLPPGCCRRASRGGRTSP